MSTALCRARRSRRLHRVALALSFVALPGSWCVADRFGPRELKLPRPVIAGEYETLPPLDEPLVPRDVPAAWRSIAMAESIEQLSPIETTWHLAIINGGQGRGGARLVKLASSNPGQGTFTQDRESWPVAPMGVATWLWKSSEQDTTTNSFSGPGAIPIAGDFDGDGRAEHGCFVDGRWFIDLNGNDKWDDEDMLIELGSAGDQPLTGDWDGDGKCDVAVFGPAWRGDGRAIDNESGLPDAANELALAEHESSPARGELRPCVIRRARGSQPVIEPVRHVLHYGAPGDVPVVGDFNGDGIDTVGVFRQGRWVLDVNGDGRFDENDQVVEMGSINHLPVVADVDGDGIDELGLFLAGRWQFDLDKDGAISESDLSFDHGRAGDLPVVRDFASDGSLPFGVHRRQ